LRSLETWRMFKYPWLKAVLFGIGLFSLAEISYFLSLKPDNLVILWLPTGLFFAVLLLNEAQTWRWYLLAACAAYLLFYYLNGISFVMNILFTSAICADAFIAVWLVRRFIGYYPGLSLLREFIGLFASAVLCAGFFALILSAVFVFLSDGYSYWERFLSFWLSDVLGVLVVAPLFISWFSFDFANLKRVRFIRVLEIILYYGGLLYVACFIFSAQITETLILDFLVLPFLLVIAMRLDMRGATTAMFFFNLLAIGYAAQGRRHNLLIGMEREHVYFLQVFLITLTFCIDMVALIITRHKQVEEELRESELKFRNFIESSNSGIVLCDEQGKIIVWNQVEEQITGIKQDEALGRPGWEIQYRLAAEKDETSERRQQLMDIWQNLVLNGKLPDHYRKMENQILRPDGKMRVIQTAVFLIQTKRGYMVGSVSQDITDDKLLAESLGDSERRFRLLVQNQGEGVCILDADDNINFANPAAEAAFGVSSDKLVGRNLKEFLDHDALMILRQEKHKRSLGKKSVYEVEICRPDGEKRWLLITATPQYDENNRFTQTFGVFRDITDRKVIESELRYLSTHDGLTGLYNRAYFEAELLRLQNSRSYPISIVISDLDDLKKINDAYGHAAGDEALRRIAELFRATFRSSDVVARLGGDEFGVILPMTESTMVGHIIKRIREQVKDLIVGDQRIVISIGCATTPVSGDLSAAMKMADDRMYQEKRRHKSAAA